MLNPSLWYSSKLLPVLAIIPNGAIGHRHSVHPSHTNTMKLHLLFVALLATTPATAGPCGMFGNTPQSIGGCTVNDSYGRPSVRITQPSPGVDYRSTPEPGYRSINPAPSTRNQPLPYGGYIGAPPSYSR